MFNISTRTSSCVNFINVNPITAYVVVGYKNGSIAHYENVSRRAILNLMINENISLGFWVNDVLLPYDTKAQLVAA
jgi:hypothetical protein